MRAQIIRAVAYVVLVALAALAVNQVQAHDNAKLRAAEMRDNAKVAAALVVADHKITAAQLEACGRGNALRQNLNGDTRIIRYFMSAIQRAAALKKDEASKERAGLYGLLASGLKNAPLVDCAKAVGQ